MLKEDLTSQRVQEKLHKTCTNFSSMGKIHLGELVEHRYMTDSKSMTGALLYKWGKIGPTGESTTVAFVNSHALKLCSSIHTHGFMLSLWSEKLPFAVSSSWCRIITGHSAEYKEHCMLTCGWEISINIQRSVEFKEECQKEQKNIGTRELGGDVEGGTIGHDINVAHIKSYQV